ncbi:nucleotidyltransferase domain-containing protein [Tahibacter soli]|uniref:Nucleotidyltransferase domain-containing protein n=1 Tax=Tahibacter soli TaxID=2983605 RepID=A0A9X3YNP1_9GAMM|nr:nucleotidyltransferase domain-containing protein [Tahibacter soli]MDC8014575.1 nucleotidyltransferase domain-containing protein [Tahibacter soli]
MFDLDALAHHRRAHVLLEAVAGSRAYGTANADSDEDVRGVFAVPAHAYLALAAPPNQVADERNNVVYYSLRRTIELLAAANPNILELVYLPDDCVRVCTPQMHALIAARASFVTRECAASHVGYAFSQIKKARGQNKWINQPQPRQAPAKEAFCHVIPARADGAPMRPRALADLGWNLAEFHAARLEHAREMFRLYHYGDAARGVFRNETLALESIPEADETARYAGLLIFREQAWRQACDDHRNYWTWRAERNEARWRQQECGEIDYDAKNLMHTVRLLLSGRSILERGEPIVRFAGDALETLLDIRAGRYAYKDVMELAQGIAADCETLKATADLPERCDVARADRLLLDLTNAWETRCA